MTLNGKKTKDLLEATHKIVGTNVVLVQKDRKVLWLHQVIWSNDVILSPDDLNFELQDTLEQ